MAIQPGSRVRAKARKYGGVEGTVVESAGSKEWRVAWDDKVDRDTFKSQQLLVLNESRRGDEVTLTTSSDSDGNIETVLVVPAQEEVDDSQDDEVIFALNDDGTTETVLETPFDPGDDDRLANDTQEEDIVENNLGDFEDESDRLFDHLADFEYTDSTIQETRQEKYEREKERLIRNKHVVDIQCNETRRIWRWTIVGDSLPDNPLDEYRETGVRGFDYTSLSDTPAADMFFHLWPGSRWNQLRNINHWIKESNKNHEARKVRSG